MAVVGLGTTLIHEHVFVLTPNVDPELRARVAVGRAARAAGTRRRRAQITAMLVHNPARYFTGGQE